MANIGLIEHLEVRNKDITLCFTCPNYGKRIRECVSNLMIDETKPDTLTRKRAFYGQASEDVMFRKGISFPNSEDGWVHEEETTEWDAFFFENTDYPLHIKANNEGIKLLRLTIGKEQSEHVSAEDAIIFGSINYKNQVGRTDIKVLYEKEGKEETLSFTTEVLSYKMDYRTDLRNVIRDIEEEFAMLSYSFLKETYLTFRPADKDVTDLIWWQIFSECFDKITEATRLIINNPKRRLQTSVRYERAERMPYMPAELENEYEEFKDEPSHLYRMQEMYLSKDTVENRFLKYALKNIADRFKHVRKNVLKVIKADNVDMLNRISEMDEELTSLSNDPFFRGIGTFKGFTQDSLVMKQAAGYRDIYEQWIILQCGYDLQDGIMQLEVKDISELYEIWCFIKVKNIVQHILRNTATACVDGKKMEGDFIKALVQGSKSEVVFLDNEKPDVQLASVMYNATTDDEEHLSDETEVSKNTDIADTTSKTTEQRPDIVLRLSKTDDKIQYTYLFDAKYRIRDTSIPINNGVEVPPVDAINQLHRYRDAIYYTNASDEKLKREVIGGYVLYPGNLTKEEFIGSYYHKSVDEVNIGAYPLKPGGHWHQLFDKKGKYTDVLLDSTSSEDVLYKQIEKWIMDDNAGKTLLEISIPQKGLKYITENKNSTIEKELVLVGCLRSKSHREWVLNNGKYNIRLDMGSDAVDGAIKPTRDFMNVSHVLLYNEDAKTVDHYFNIDAPNNEMPETYGYNKLKELSYPFNINRTPKKTYKKRTEQKYGKRAYLIYNIEPVPMELPNQQVVNMETLLEKYINEDTPIGNPFVITMRELMEFLIKK